jgi:hypothetical protein
MMALICKIPPNLPFPKGVIIPLFGKEGLGEIFFLVSLSNTIMPSPQKTKRP